MEELTEVITSAEFHPKHCNQFVYSISKGSIRLCDMRESALCDQHAKGEETLFIAGWVGWNTFLPSSKFDTGHILWWIVSSLLFKVGFIGMILGLIHGMQTHWHIYAVQFFYFNVCPVLMISYGMCKWFLWWSCVDAAKLSLGGIGCMQALHSQTTWVRHWKCDAGHWTCTIVLLHANV